MAGVSEFFHKAWLMLCGLARACMNNQLAI